MQNYSVIEGEPMITSASRWKNNLPVLFWAALMLLMASETVVLAFSSWQSRPSHHTRFRSPNVSSHVTSTARDKDQAEDRSRKTEASETFDADEP
jgi:hypothetical protein